MSPGGAYRNQIDYVLIDTRWRSSITNAKTLPGADCGSDHQLLVAEFKARLKVVYKASNNKTLHMHADAISQFRQDMHTRLLGMETDLTESANDITLKKNGLSTEDDRRHYRELHRTVQRLCRKDKDAEEVDRVCQKIEESSNRAHTKDMFCKVKSLTKDIKIKSWTLEDDTGAIITDRYKVLERWREYCRGLYAATENSEELRMSECGVREPDILLAEIEWAVARLKHQTSGGDRVSPNAQEPRPRGHAHAPLDLSEGLETISLLSHASKILLSIIKARLENYIDRHISEEQAGFVKGKGTRKQILNVRQLIEKSREFNVPLLMCFIDYAKAFDCVSWKRMFEVMREMGVPETLDTPCAKPVPGWHM
ncbi:uncharacterized protein LOC112467877 [Temnothorax curvispinosus]|uniref:Uncharacterized protein LOC112467877 n=1 Tax=Temnothorax curvispinosus TaxID=300111 RepID=A0A6J1RCL9_9HYME|nr:uncharacterized protein LOC112467877 [Temnothorax curvispinosus]